MTAEHGSYVKAVVSVQTKKKLRYQRRRRQKKKNASAQDNESLDGKLIYSWTYRGSEKTCLMKVT